MQAHSGYDLYEPRSAACQLDISVSYLKDSVRQDSSAPVIMGRGMIACNTSALQQWWDGKQHHTHGSNALGRSLYNARVSGVSECYVSYAGSSWIYCLNAIHSLLPAILLCWMLLL
jgi:hypothetical protein